eukprot:6224522-Prymnesium_polylepis.1
MDATAPDSTTAPQHCAGSVSNSTTPLTALATYARPLAPPGSSTSRLSHESGGGRACTSTASGIESLRRAASGRVFRTGVAADQVAVSQLRQNGYTHRQPPEECDDRADVNPSAFLHAPSLLGRTHVPLVIERQCQTLASTADEMAHDREHLALPDEAGGLYRVVSLVEAQRAELLDVSGQLLHSGMELFRKTVHERRAHFLQPAPCVSDSQQVNDGLQGADILHPSRIEHMIERQPWDRLLDCSGEAPSLVGEPVQEDVLLAGARVASTCRCAHDFDPSATDA